MNYRLYNKGEEKVICELFYSTFATSEGHDEGKLIKQLVDDFFKMIERDEIFVFIAEKDGEIVGSIILSRLKISSKENIFLLAPVAVKTEYQGKGIGQNIIKYSLDFLKKKNVSIVITYGDINFYSKAGFKKISEEIIKAPLSLSYPEGWLAQSLDKNEISPIKGITYCAEALNNPQYW